MPKPMSNTMTTPHTPTPWRNGEKYIEDIYGGDKFIAGVSVGFIKSQSDRDRVDADAAYIVRCVNAHDDLVAALQEMIIQFNDISGANQKIGEKIALSNARAALAKATQ
jgi:hypothetical protein